MQEVLEAIERWKARGEQVALATVVKVIGSAPRDVGAKMVVSSSGEMAGSVSGGCVEGAVFEIAQEVLRTGRPRLVRFGISDEMAWDVGLACGGTIEVFIEPLP
jgi:xanthine/CO dehydrogenase XdhC/CoxF family maturation factor